MKFNEQTARNGLRITIWLMLSERSAQTGLLEITSASRAAGEVIEPRRLLFSTPEVADAIGDLMIDDWGRLAPNPRIADLLNDDGSRVDQLYEESCARRRQESLDSDY